MCSMVAAGLPQEAVIVLQEAQLWRYAATLTANTLTGSDRAITLERWAAHIHQVSCYAAVSPAIPLLTCVLLGSVNFTEPPYQLY